MQQSFYMKVCKVLWTKGAVSTLWASGVPARHWTVVPWHSVLDNNFTDPILVNQTVSLKKKLFTEILSGILKSSPVYTDRLPIEPFVCCPWLYFLCILHFCVNAFCLPFMLALCNRRIFFSSHDVCVMILVPEFVEITGVCFCRKDFVNTSELVKTWLRALLD